MKEKEKKTVVVGLKVDKSRLKHGGLNRGLNYVPGCAHDSDEGGSDFSDDEDDQSSRKLLELEKEFSKAWRHWKAKMASVDWMKVCFV